MRFAGTPLFRQCIIDFMANLSTCCYHSVVNGFLFFYGKIQLNKG